MSSSLAFALPERAGVPHARPGQQPRHIEIVTTKAQRRARPRVFYAIVTTGALFALFLVQLLLSIVISEGAYQISGLQSAHRQLDREEQALTETLDLLSSPQNLATRAESLGMVLSTSTPVFLRLADGVVVGSVGNGARGGVLLGATGNLVPNALLADLPAQGIQPTATSATGAPDATAASTSVASTSESLPSPVTR